MQALWKHGYYYLWPWAHNIFSLKCTQVNSKTLANIHEYKFASYVKVYVGGVYYYTTPYFNLIDVFSLNIDSGINWLHHCKIILAHRAYFRIETSTAMTCSLHVYQNYFAKQTNTLVSSSNNLLQKWSNSDKSCSNDTCQ